MRSAAKLLDTHENARGSQIMQLKDVMTRNVEVIEPDATLEDAASRMDALDIGPLPVCENDRLIGMITDRDITVRSTALGQDPKTTHVREAMSKDVLYCHEDDDVGEAIRLMETNQVRRLPVLNREDRLVGIISIGDLAVETRNERLSGEVLTRVSEPSKPDR
jgi:CBS domain-containing protein